MKVGDKVKFTGCKLDCPCYGPHDYIINQKLVEKFGNQTFIVIKIFASPLDGQVQVKDEKDEEVNISFHDEDGFDDVPFPSFLAVHLNLVKP